MAEVCFDPREYIIVLDVTIREPNDQGIIALVMVAYFKGGKVIKSWFEKDFGLKRRPVNRLLTIKQTLQKLHITNSKKYWRIIITKTEEGQDREGRHLQRHLGLAFSYAFLLDS